MTALRAKLRRAAARLADAGIESADRDAALLLAHVLGCELGEVRRREVLGHELSDGDMARFEALVDERARRVPLQHLTGRAPFRSLELRVGPGVFVPRPETEMLVDAALEAAPHGGRIVDLCTGSGAIALAIKAERPDLEIYAVELSEEAAAWAALNCKQSGLTVNLSVEDARQALPELEGSFDVVVSNPPYVPTGMVPIDPEVAEHDPEIALYGGSEDGLRFPLEIAERAAHLLKPGGLLVMEHADAQGESLPEALLDRRGFEWARDEADLAGKPRMTLARREGGSRFEVPTSPAERPVRRRATVRLLVLDHAGDVLLYEDSDQGLTPPATWWSTPGGGIDPGESERDAAVRELFEETGLQVEADAFVGPIARRRVVHGYSDSVVRQDDVFYAVRTTRFEPDPGALTPEEQVTMQRWRWWSVRDLETTSERVWPREIAALVSARATPDATAGSATSVDELQPDETVALDDVEESTVPVALGHR
ncbi:MULTISPECIES: peptide chain release factor N(5)-glutamine methyltransferase [Dermacoccus]|uniref:peptide chain release factor N(5)-glutamine methyltransferase n=1 Tax=Dermacoccus TaxID=57495 RepID=UPI00093E0B2E|nr:peptide chain release factor N(5)-glutamine methyltransferase [Dermacoccus nishinomiyaensis]MBO1759580.1 peptide chain release factor N(5)-glutamine methyltransferase [Dermacoccus sp. NHGro5]